MGLGNYLFKRTAYNLLILVLIAVVNFIIFRLIPADPVSIFAGGRFLRPNQIAALVKLYGLNKPLWEQFADYMVAMYSFNFGYSFQTSDTVWNGISPRLFPTLILIGGSTVISIVIGLLIGVVSAARRGGVFDAGVQAISLFTYALPAFWLGYIFLLFFFVQLHWFPGFGFVNADLQFGSIAYITDLLWHLTLPTLTLVLITVGGWALLMRNSLLEVLTEDYIVTARAKGLPERTVLYKHAARNALLPVVTQVALTFGFVLSGAVLTETVFTWNGLGTYIFHAVVQLDYPVLQAVFFLIAITVVVANFIADVVYGFLDPRIRY